MEAGKFKKKFLYKKLLELQRNGDFEKTERNERDNFDDVQKVENRTKKVFGLNMKSNKRM